MLTIVDPEVAQAFVIKLFFKNFHVSLSDGFFTRF
jgi:hypothetical protein